MGLTEERMPVFDASPGRYLPSYLPKRHAFQRDYQCIKLRKVTVAFGSGV